AGFDDLLWREAGVTNRNFLECAAIRDEHPVGADEAIKTGVQLICAAAVVGVDQAKLRGVFTFDWHHIAALETNQVLLEAASFLDLDALLDGGHRSPTSVAQAEDE